MNKKLYYFVSLILVVLLGYGIYLLALIYIRDGVKLTDEVSPQKAKEYDIPPGELGVDTVTGSVSVPFLQEALNNVWIKEFSVTEDSGLGSAKVELTLGYKEGGIERSFKTTIVGDVYLSEYVKYGPEGFLKDVGKVPVNLIPFEKGEFLALTYAYFTTGEKDGKNKLSVFCKIRDDAVCAGYPQLGFGGAPVGQGALVSRITGETKSVEPPEFALRSYIRNFAIPKVIE